MKKFLSLKMRWLRIIMWSFIGIGILFVSLLITAFIVTPQLSNYKSQVVNSLQTTLEYPISLEDMQAKWRWFSPVVSLKNVVVWNTHRDAQLISIENLQVTISVWDLLFKQKIVTNSIEIDHLRTSLHQTTSGNFQFIGFEKSDSQSPENMSELLNVISLQDNITIRDITLNVYLRDGTHYVIANVIGELTHAWGDIKVNVEGALLEPQHAPPVRSLIKLYATLDPNHLVPSEWQGDVAIVMEQVDVPTWTKIFPEIPAHIQSGTGRVALYSTWNNGKPQMLQTSLALEKLSFSLPFLENEPAWHDAKLSGDLEWLQMSEGWQLTGKDLSITRDNLHMPATTFQINQKVPKVFANADLKTQLEESAYTIYFDQVDLDIMEDVIKTSPLLRSKLPAWWPMDLSGKLNQVKAEITDFTKPSPIVRLSSQFNNLGMAYHEAYKVGFRGLSGSIDLTPTSGALIVDSEQVQVQAPSLFTVGIELPRLNSTVNWNKQELGWLIEGNAKTGVFEHGMLDVSGTLHLLPNIGESEIDITASGSNIPAVPAIAMYLPRPVIPAGTVKWLDLAIQGGTAQQVNMILKGKLKDYPYSTPSKPGKFEAKIHMIDAQLNYHPDWPVITQMDGQVIFRSNAFYANILSGKIGGEDITQALVSIPEMKRSGFDLKVKGQAHGQAENLVNFLDQTPLKEKFGESLKIFSFSGPIETDLSLNIPIAKPNEKSEVSGVIDFSDNIVSLPTLNLSFSNVKGQLTFDENGLYSDNINATLYNQPVSMQMSTIIQTNAPNYLSMKMSGLFDAQTLSTQYPNPVWNNWRGITPFSAILEWRNKNDKKDSTLVINSSLSNVIIDLPAPFTKTADQTKPLILTATFGPTQQQLNVQYNSLLNSNLVFGEKNNEKALLRGTATILNKSAVDMPTSGLKIVGDIPTLNIDEWLPVIEKAAQNTNGNKTNPEISATFNTQKIILFDKNWEIRNLNVQSGTSQWKVGVSGADIKGQVIIPQDMKANPIALNLSYLSLKKDNSETAKQDIPFPPENFPNFTVKIDHLLLNNKTVGQLSLNAKKEKSAISFNSMKLTNPGYSFSGAGRWESGKMQTVSYLQGAVISQDLGLMLKNLGLYDSMEKGKGKTSFDLSWVGSPIAWNLPGLQGTMDIDWANAHLTQIKPGLGRILSLFNVSSLTRRLRLDFSDIVKKGFTFDKLTSHLNFNQGVIATTDGKVTSTSGEIDFNGKAFATNKTLDMNLTVKPSLTGPLPIAATVASGGNPLVGALAFAVDKAVTPKITGGLVVMKYHVTGTWEDPKIEKTK